MSKSLSDPITKDQAEWLAEKIADYLAEYDELLSPRYFDDFAAARASFLSLAHYGEGR